MDNAGCGSRTKKQTAKIYEPDTRRDEIKKLSATRAGKIQDAKNKISRKLQSARRTLRDAPTTALDIFRPLSYTENGPQEPIALENNKSCNTYPY